MRTPVPLGRCPLTGSSSIRPSLCNSSCSPISARLAIPISLRLSGGACSVIGSRPLSHSRFRRVHGSCFEKSDSRHVIFLSILQVRFGFEFDKSQTLLNDMDERPRGYLPTLNVVCVQLRLAREQECRVTEARLLEIPQYEVIELGGVEAHCLEKRTVAEVWVRGLAGRSM